MEIGPIIQQMLYVKVTLQKWRQHELEEGEADCILKHLLFPTAQILILGDKKLKSGQLLCIVSSNENFLIIKIVTVWKGFDNYQHSALITINLTPIRIIF